MPMLDRKGIYGFCVSMEVTPSWTSLVPRYCSLAKLFSSATFTSEDTALQALESARMAVSVVPALDFEHGLGAMGGSG